MEPDGHGGSGDGGARSGADVPRLTRRGLLAGAAGAGLAAGAVAASPATAGAASPSATGGPVRLTSSSSRVVDVVVIGAGLSGLTAATELERAGRSVVVLEARHRVGGRNYDVTVDGGVEVELGGEWTGPGQTRVQALAHELGIATFDAYSDGNNLYYRNGALSTYQGVLPSVDPTTLGDLLRAISALNQLAAGVPVTAPWRAARAPALDVETVASWIAGQGYTEEAAFLANLSVRAVYGEEPTQVGLMDLLGEIAGVGGDFNTAIGSAQSVRFLGGPQQLSERLAERLHAPIHRGSPVVAVERGRTVTVHTTAASYRARQVIVTVPKSVTAAVRFEPALPPAFAQYFQRQPTGATVKIQAVYDTPFWRSEGLSGSVVSDTGPIEVVYDNSPPDARRGVLVGFAEGDFGRSLFGLSPAARRSTVLASLARYFGPRATRVVDYVDLVWASEPYSGGAYGSYNPPGVVTSLGAAVSGPIGNLRFAGADWSPEWPGYMEGAIRSGSAAAAAVHAEL